MQDSFTPTGTFTHTADDPSGGYTNGQALPATYRTNQNQLYNSVGGWDKTVEDLHTQYHSSADPIERDRVATQAQALAGQRAITTGRSPAQILQESGFHPVSGHSMRPPISVSSEL